MRKKRYQILKKHKKRKRREEKERKKWERNTILCHLNIFGSLLQWSQTNQSHIKNIWNHQQQNRHEIPIYILLQGYLTCFTFKDLHTKCNKYRQDTWPEIHMYTNIHSFQNAHSDYSQRINRKYSEPVLTVTCTGIRKSHSLLPRIQLKRCNTDCCHESTVLYQQLPLVSDTWPFPALCSKQTNHWETFWCLKSITLK